MDVRIETFLTLCETMNYRAAAEKLHITQPAVTKQIQSIENEYGVKLFKYDGRKLWMTKECEIMQEYVRSLKYNYDEMANALKNKKENLIRIGATKTIGEYVIGEHIGKYLEKEENNLSLIVENTEKLLEKLDNNQLDFIFVEGVVSKERYDYRLLREEKFTGICNRNSKIAGKTVDVKELLGETLLVRETGSGTRNILVRELEEKGYSIESFKKSITISSFEIIKEMIEKNIGITFAYEAIMKENDRFSTFEVKNWKKKHDFNIVYLKHTNVKHLVEAFLGEDDLK